MPTVLHLLNRYLPATETFIWQYLRQAQNYPPQLLADAYENLERFPLAGGAAARLELPVLRPWWRRGWAAMRGTYAPVDYRGIEAALAGRNIVLAHTHQGYRACVTQPLLRRLGLPFVASFYGSDVSRTDLLARARSGYAQVFRQAGALLAEGPRLRQRLIDLGAPEVKVRLMPIAIDLDDYHFQERQWDGRRPIRLLFTGRLVEKKGLAMGLAALALAARKQGAPEFHLTVVGDGPLRQAMEARVNDLGLAGRVNFAGMVRLDVLRDLMQQHDALLAPSCTAANGDAEGGAPTVLLEAQACGMPIVATTHDDIPFVTVPGKSALLVAERDAVALAEALLTLAEWGGTGNGKVTADSAGDAPPSWATMGKAGRAHVAAFHDARVTIAAMEKMYAEVIAQR